MDQSFLKAPVKGEKQRNNKYDIQEIHTAGLRSHKLTDFFGNSIMFLFALDQKKADL
jgi:hypothetical protein